MTKAHDVWNFDWTHEVIHGRVYWHDGETLAFKAVFSMEETHVASAANYSTTYQIELQKVEGAEAIERTKQVLYRQE